MTRGIGAIAALRDLLPDAVISALAAATHAGDAAVLLGIAVAVYLFRDRRAGAFVLAAVVGGFGLIAGSKALFALPRPPAALWLGAADGYGFPSGHALGSTVGWGAMAIAADAWMRRRRFAAAAAVAGVVSLSRVAIGVHYAVDVLAGVGIGLAYLALLAWWTRGDPDRAFGVALAATIVGVLAGGASGTALVLLGAAVGGLAVWTEFDPPARPWGVRDAVPAAAVGVVVGGVLFVGAETAVAPPVGFVLGIVGAGTAIGAPTAVERLAG